MYSLSDPWTIAFTQVALISSLPTLILLLFPNSINSKSNNGGLILKAAKAVSAGGLIGDCFLHSLPEAMGAENAGLAVIFGFVVFMALNLISGGGHDNHGHDHHGGHKDPVDGVVSAVDDMIDSSVQDVVNMKVNLIPLSTIPESERAGKNVILDGDGEDDDDVLFTVVRSKGGWVEVEGEGGEKSKKRAKSLLIISESLEEPEEEEEEKVVTNSSASSASLWTSPQALLNLVGDFLHNFTDGLAIGVSALTSDPMTVKSLLTPLSIMLHEVPHELGDFAVLVSCGFSKWGAIRMQFATAIGAFVGCLVGLSAVDIFESEFATLLIPFCCGGFIYLATVGLLADVVNGRNGKMEGFVILGAFCLGVGCLFWLTLLEGEHGHGHGHSHGHGGGCGVHKEVEVHNHGYVHEEFHGHDSHDYDHHDYDHHDHDYHNHDHHDHDHRDHGHSHDEH